MICFAYYRVILTTWPLASTADRETDRQLVHDDAYGVCVALLCDTRISEESRQEKGIPDQQSETRINVSRNSNNMNFRIYFL